LKPSRVIQVSSKNPAQVAASLQGELPRSHLLPPVSLDITRPDTLDEAFEGADVIVNLVGVLVGSSETFEKIQWRGAENVARAARRRGAKLVHMSAIGAEKTSTVPYARTKALGEEAVLEQCADATIIRPSLIFGPDDSFFNVGAV